MTRWLVNLTLDVANIDIRLVILICNYVLNMPDNINNKEGKGCGVRELLHSNMKWIVLNFAARKSNFGKIYKLS